MRPHEQRVVNEKRDLDAKMAKLGNFIGTPSFVELDAEDQKLLLLQFDAMRRYGIILRNRIERFERS